MAKFALPTNSKILKGKFYKDKTGSKNIKIVNVYRWNPDDGQNPRIDTFEVDMDKLPKVLISLKLKTKLIHLLRLEDHAWSLRFLRYERRWH